MPKRTRPLGAGTCRPILRVALLVGHGPPPSPQGNIIAETTSGRSGVSTSGAPRIRLQRSYGCHPRGATGRRYWPIASAIFLKLRFGSHRFGHRALSFAAAALPTQPKIVHRRLWNRSERIRKPSRVAWPKYVRPLSPLPKSGGPGRSSSRRAERREPELGTPGTIPGGPSSTWLRRHFLRSAGL